MITLTEQLGEILPAGLSGSVVRTIGTTAAVADFPAPVGAVVSIERHSGPPVEAEVIGFRDDLTLVFPLSDMSGVRHGSRVTLVRTSRWLRVGPELMGRVLDAHGEVIDSQPRPAL